MKKTLFHLCLTLLLLPLSVIASNNEIRKETYIYSIKDQDTLYLDKYDISSKEIRPCVIFVFGGGFFTGARDVDYYMPYYDFLVNEGYVVVTIDYRLGFKKAEGQKLKKAKEFLALFENTIFMATEDFLDATNYVLENADKWGINRNKIVASGSSAGGITVLQGEYERANRTEIAQRLPQDFKYAGIISFAGAIYSNKGNLKWKNTPAPVLMFHGDADSNVPFDRIKIFRRGFFGSKYIADKYEKHNFPYSLYVEENGNHKLAVDPMTKNQDEIRTFLKKCVEEEQMLQINTKVENMERPVEKKKFKMQDYVKSNF